MAKNKAGIRFSQEEYIFVNMETMRLTKETPEGVEEYTIGEGGGSTKTLLWENSEPTKGLKVDTVIATPEDIYENDTLKYDYFKCNYKNINSGNEIITIIIPSSAFITANKQMGLVSTGDVDETTGLNKLYVRRISYDVTNGVIASGECHEVSSEYTNKNFRAVPITFYGIKENE